MALSKLSGDEAGIVFTQLCNVLEPRDAVDFSSVSNELRELTQALLQQLRADHEAAAALGHKAGMRSCQELREAFCPKVGMRSCKELREATVVDWKFKSLSSADWATLGSLGSVLPALERLALLESPVSVAVLGADCTRHMQRLAAGLQSAGALQAVTYFACNWVHVGDAGASALAAALGRGALPQLKELYLGNAGIGDAGLVALAPALQRRPALERLILWGNPLGDEGIAALVAPPPPAVAPSPPTGGLAKLKELDLEHTYVSDAGCAVLATALDGGALPALECLELGGIPASAAAKAAVYEAHNLEHNESGSESDYESAQEDEEEEDDEEGEEEPYAWNSLGVI
eukprot:scaffold27882_cov61-Phaeocystis_antarctica.AAC.4